MLNSPYDVTKSHNPQSKVKRKKTNPLQQWDEEGIAKKKTAVDVKEQLSHQQTLPPSAKNMSDIIKEENYC